MNAYFSGIKPATLLYTTGVAGLVLSGWWLLSVTLCLWMGISINMLPPFFVFVVVGWGLWLHFGHVRHLALGNMRKLFQLSTQLLILSVLLSGAIASIFFDTSHDGQTYQQQAVGQLATGWNPYRDGALGQEVRFFTWLNGYTKAPWLIEASLFHFTGHVQWVKGISLFAAFQAFFLVSGFLFELELLKKWLAVSVATLLVFSPVVICQIFTFYVDGLAASYLLALLALFAWGYFYRRALHWQAVAACLLILANIKFTTCVYAVVLYAAYLLWLLNEKRMPQLKTALAVGFVSALLGVLVIGYNPYITNILRHGHPLHPLAGTGKVDILTDNAPAGWPQKDRFGKFGLALNARAANAKIVNPNTVSLKIPFSFSIDELKIFHAADVRAGGFGVWFGGMFYVCIAGWILFALKRPARLGKLALFTSLALLASVVVNPEFWWARYVPQLWCWVILSGVFWYVSGFRMLQRAAMLLWLLAAVNVGLVASANVAGNYVKSSAVKTELQTLPANIKLKNGGVWSVENRLREAGIGVITVPDSVVLGNEKVLSYSIEAKVGQ